MFSFASIRPRLAEWRGWLPLAALPALMFAALMALGGERGYFYRYGGIHSWNTAKTLAISENLSPEHNFRLATRVWRDEDGGFRYSLYSRFPIGGYALVKAATLPFGDDLAAKILAARVLMLTMFCGAALFACLSIARATGSRWVALAATALGFSGLYVLYYADGVFNEGVMDLFGVALAFHGMVVFVQEGRFRQLLVKTCAALLLGWHVYALLLPFIVLGFGGEALALSRAAVSANDKIKAARAAIVALVRSRYVALAAVSILFGSVLLGFNLANEYAARAEMEGRVSDTATFRSMLLRLGVNSWGFEWDSFIKQQLYRVGVSSAPYALARAGGLDFPISEPLDLPAAPAVFGAAATAAALAALAFVRGYRRMLAATAVLYGFCWTIPLRHTAKDHQHVWEGMPYIGLTLALFTFALILARRAPGERLGGVVSIAAAALAAPIFALSVFHAGEMDRDDYGAERHIAEMEEFSAIRATTRGSAVFLFPEDAIRNRQEKDYYLAGSYARMKRPDICSPEVWDYVVGGYRAELPNLLTPDNEFAFLYESLAPLELCRAERRRLEASEPAARSVFDVYLQDGALSYLKAPCSERDYGTEFYRYVHPVDLDDLPARFRREGFHPTRYGLSLRERGAVFDGVCLMTLRLPTYPIAAVQTGQWLPGEERLWEVFVNPPLDGETLAFYEKAYQAIAASGEPAARAGGFDLYLDGDSDTLSYLKAPCGEGDTRGRFFLSVHPVDAGDLPEERREVGHESLNFTFAPPAGVVFDGKCMSTRQLPDYDIARIETGQWIPGGERVWDGEIVVGD